jgi:hypothetical protein
MTTLTAMLCAAMVTAQFISGKATRDALFLTALDFTALPAMLVGTLLVALNFRAARRIPPATLVPGLFAASGVLFLVQALLRSHAPSSAAISIYLHISGAGPLLASGFWLIASERFDPRSAKKHFGRIAGAGTLGGLVGALATERVGAIWGAPAMLPVLAAIQFLSAWLVRQPAVSGAIDPIHESWQTPVDAYFRHTPAGWTLVGFERMPEWQPSIVSTN